MKLDNIRIHPIEKGFIVDVALEDPKAKDKWNTIDKEYFCSGPDAVIAIVTDLLNEKE